MTTRPVIEWPSFAIIIKDALKVFFDHNRPLLEAWQREEALYASLKSCLENRLKEHTLSNERSGGGDWPELHVDTQLNHLSDGEIKRLFQNCPPRLFRNASIDRVTPDIVIHDQNPNDTTNNLLVIEVKKWKADASTLTRNMLKDKVKLVGYVQTFLPVGALKYDYAVSLCIGSRNKPCSVSEAFCLSKEDLNNVMKEERDKLFCELVDCWVDLIDSGARERREPVDEKLKQILPALGFKDVRNDLMPNELALC